MNTTNFSEELIRTIEAHKLRHNNTNVPFKFDLSKTDNGKIKLTVDRHPVTITTLEGNVLILDVDMIGDKQLESLINSFP